MRKGLLRLSLLGLALASACADDPTPPASDVTTTIGGDGSRIHRSASGRLTAPSQAQVTDVVKSYLHAYVEDAVDQMSFVSQTAPINGISHVRYEQVVGGLRVYGAYARAAITDRGELVQVIENLAPITGLPRAASIKHKDALAVAMKEHGYDFATPAQTSGNGNKLGFDKGTEFFRGPTVEKVAYYEGNALKQGFLVETWSLRGNQLDHTLVSGNGAIVAHELRTQNDSYNVFTEDPWKTAQTVTAGPGAGNAESPVGWLAGAQTTRNISGNNVHAYLDKDANGQPDPGGSSATDTFGAVANLAASPASGSNLDVAVQNLFYLNNVIHDITYRHGFDEAAGNFQNDNFGLGGAGGDAVNAEAQDGGGTDNANFSTPTDGSPGRMQMYLWSGAGPNAIANVGGTAYGAWGSSFGRALTTTPTAGAPLALVNDGAGTTTDGCEASPVGSLSGKVALVDRGTCDFTVKVLNAQKAGAVAVLIANNVGGNPAGFSPGGTNRKVTIPSAMVSLADRPALVAAAGATTTLASNPNPPLQIDASLDADIVFHEFGHGLTWRIIGGMSGAISGAIGEGASDVLAFLINGDDRIAEYSYSSDAGIRRYGYNNYPLTYAAVDGGEVHNDGEIYAAAMWRVFQNYLGAGLTADDVLTDWIAGMQLTASQPSFEAMRDGMVAAAGSARACLVWRGFAATGIGVGSAISGRRRLTVTESFAVPAQCQ